MEGEGHTAPLAWCPDGIFPQLTPARWADGNPDCLKEWIAEGFFDLVVVESARGRAMKAWGELKGAIRDWNLPILLHDGEDYANFNFAALDEIRPDVYAKRELTKNNPSVDILGKTLIVPCPFSAPDRLADLPASEESFPIDAVFLCGDTDPLRRQVADALIQSGMTCLVTIQGDVNRNLGVSGPLGWQDYIEVLRTARVGVSVRGAGWDTCRYWETAAITGLIADELGIHIPHPFEDGETALLFHTASGAADRVRWAKENPSDYAIIRQRGIEHARKHHLNSCRAQQMIDHLREHAGLEAD